MHLSQQQSKCFTRGRYVADKAAEMGKEPTRGFIGSTNVVVQIKQVLPFGTVVPAVLFERFLPFGVSTAITKAIDNIDCLTDTNIHAEYACQRCCVGRISGETDSAFAESTCQFVFKSSQCSPVYILD